MKIAIVTDAWLPQVNGVVTTYLKTIELLNNRGFEVMTITPQRFRTIPCPTYPEIPLSLVRTTVVHKLLNDFSPRSIHIATEGPLGWAARRSCLRTGLPFTTSYHTRFPEYVRMRLPLPLRLSYSVMRRFHNKGQCIMVSSSQLKQEMEQKGFHNVSLWSRGVDTELFKPAEGEINQQERPYFTYLGRVAPEKNLDAFLDLDLPGPKMVIGDGPLLETLKGRYPETRFTGFKKGRELVELLNQSRVFVFPSLTDTLGVVQLEAMACGLPVAAFPVDGPKSLIINGHNGWMHDDLKQAVVNCLDIDGERCRAFAMQFTWEACTDQFVSNLCFEAFEFPSAGHLFAEAA